MNDLKSVMSSQPRGSYAGTKASALNMLMSYYNYKENTDLTGTGVIDGFAEFKTRTRSLDRSTIEFLEGFLYSDIQSPGKNLKSKIAGIDNPLRRGKLYGTKRAETPDELVMNFFNEYADNAVNGSSFSVPNGNLPAQTVTGSQTAEYGVDLAQMVQKFFHGAVSYSQAARDYLSTDLGASKGLNADNSKPAKQGASYTAMEHHFDEAFGYFGAAKDFSLYTDKEVRIGSRDTNNDGFIAFLSEYNTGISTNTSRFDLTAFDGKVDLSGEAINAFLAGRHLIKSRPADYKKYVVAHAKVALGAWEKTLGAVTIHYINASLSTYKKYGSNSYLFTNFAKYWSEMKGFSLAFQFNPHGMMSDSDFDMLHSLLRDQPVLPHAPSAQVDAYKKDLLKAREILRKTYGFSLANASNW